MFRWIFGLPGAALVTAALFLAMYAMVTREAGPIAPEPPIDLSILPKIIDSPPKPRPPRPENPAPPKPIEIDFPDRLPNPGPTIPTGEFFPDPEPRDIDDFRMTAPTVKISPAYPETCRARGVEGVVIVEFDVTPSGDVVNPRIVSSPDGCFDRAVLRAVAGWKYSPKIVDGRPAAQRGAREVFSFRLTE